MDNYNIVLSELARWQWADGPVLIGLVDRRSAEAGLWAAGAFVSYAQVEVGRAKTAPLLVSFLAY